MSADVVTHLQEHIKEWPASKQDIIQSCNMISDIPEEERKWVMENLPDKIYNSPDEALMELDKAKTAM